MSRTLRPLAALALVALIGLISAGCGSNAPSETGTASSSGSGSSSGTTGSTGTASSAGTGGTKKLTARDKAVKFAECIRAHGVSDFWLASGVGRAQKKAGRATTSSPATPRLIWTTAARAA